MIYKTAKNGSFGKLLELRGQCFAYYKQHTSALGTALFVSQIESYYASYREKAYDMFRIGTQFPVDLEDWREQGRLLVEVTTMIF